MHSLVCLFSVLLTAADSAPLPETKPSAIGVTKQGTKIACLLADEADPVASAKTRILLVGGLDGDDVSPRNVLAAVRWFQTDAAAKPLRETFVVSAVPNANPDRQPQRDRGYPPTGSAYDGPAPESAYLWRWIGLHAPDFVVVVRGGEASGFRFPKGVESVQKLATRLAGETPVEPADAIAAKLPAVAVADTGAIPAAEWHSARDGEFLPQLLTAMQAEKFTGPSPARRELQARAARSPREVAEQLSRHYGKDLPVVEYIPAVAVIGRLRLGQLDGEAGQSELDRILGPYVRGEKPTSPKNGSALAGHLLFTELAKRTAGERRAKCIELARRAADLGFDEQGRPREVMPFHTEMSDAVFMGGPILASVGQLTGEPRYFDACVRHLAFMRKLVLRPDGLYRHSPLDETAWGRGNGFPALGLALVLTDFPADHPRRDELLQAFRDHLQALVRHQDATGMWHQVVDREESYRELSCTCMIAFAMARGVRSGWLERSEFQPSIDRAWSAIRLRVAANGRLVDVCTGTGKQKSLRDYYDRPAILGPDPRGGAMALLIATELDRNR